MAGDRAAGGDGLVLIRSCTSLVWDGYLDWGLDARHSTKCSYAGPMTDR